MCTATTLPDMKWSNTLKLLQRFLSSIDDAIIFCDSYRPTPGLSTASWSACIAEDTSLWKPLTVRIRDGFCYVYVPEPLLAFTLKIVIRPNTCSYCVFSVWILSKLWSATEHHDVIQDCDHVLENSVQSMNNKSSHDNTCNRAWMGGRDRIKGGWGWGCSTVSH